MSGGVAAAARRRRPHPRASARVRTYDGVDLQLALVEDVAHEVLQLVHGRDEVRARGARAGAVDVVEGAEGVVHARVVALGLAEVRAHDRAHTPDEGLLVGAAHGGVEEEGPGGVPVRELRLDGERVPGVGRGGRRRAGRQVQRQQRRQPSAAAVLVLGLERAGPQPAAAADAPGPAALLGQERVVDRRDGPDHLRLAVGAHRPPPRQRRQHPRHLHLSARHAVLHPLPDVRLGKGGGG